MAVKLGPAYELQLAIVEAVKANADMIALCKSDKWLHQDVPAGAKPPYVTIGEGQDVPDLAECIDGSEIYLDFHAWALTFEATKKMLATLWAAIEAANISLSENRLVLLERDVRRDLRDPDGVTKHSVLTLRALTEPN